jgi:hypothetical protein
MDARDVYNLYEAYRSVYVEQEALNEDVDYELEEAAPIISKGVSVNAKGEKIPWTHTTTITPTGTKSTVKDKFGERELPSERTNLDKSRGNKKSHYREDLDIYDVVLDHLLDEGYCDDVESAEIIMANMSEEWVDEIVEANRGEQRYLPGDKSAAARATRRNANFANTKYTNPREIEHHTQTRRELHQMARGVKKKARPYGPGGWAASQRVADRIST